MQLDDMILVSIDDHVVEPPDMFARHVPAKYRDEAPKVVVTDDKGVDQWMYQGRPTGRQRTQRGGVVAGRGVGPRPRRLRRDAPRRVRRPRARPRHEPQRHPRRRCASRPSPASPRATSTSTEDEVTLRDGVGLQRLAHRRVVRRLPGPVHPARHPADVEPARRCATRSAGSRPRAAARSPCPNCRTSRDCPATTTIDYWGPVFQTLSDENVVMCLHIGTGFGAISMAPDAPIDNLIILATQVSAHARAGPAVGSGDAQLPRPEVRLLRRRHRLDPLLPGPLRPALHQPEVAASRLRRQAAERRVPRALAGLLRHRQDRR